VAWTNPFTAITGNIITAADWNTSGRDDLNYLKGLLDGTVTTTLAVSETQVLESLYATTSTKARLFQVQGVWHLSINASLSAGVWSRDNVSEVAWLYRLGGLTSGGTDSLTVLRAAPAANPITWANHLILDNAGKLTGAGFYSSGVFALAAGASAGLANPFGGTGTPRFVFGKYAAGTQTEANTTIPVGVGPASTEKVRLTVAQAATITVQSTDSVSNSVIVYAIL
jgi:hypothetical protein